jgi:transposase
MKKVKSIYVGIDVSKDTFNWHFSGRDGKNANSLSGFRKFVSEAPPGSVVGMEVTGVYHVRLASYLHSMGFRVLVFNALRVKRYMQSLGIKTKTDKSDARVICDYAKTDKAGLCGWEPLSPPLARARAIVTVLASLSKTENRSANVRHAVGVVSGSRDKTLTGIMSDVSRVCRNHRVVLERELLGIVRVLYPERLRLLRSIKGIGSYTACVMLVMTKGLDFETSGRLSSYCGLVPDLRESGVSVKGKGRIVKVGSSYLRSLLCMCAFTSVQYNPVCRSLYRRLLLRGKPKFVAMTAVMHRLVKICWGVVNSGEPYRGGRLLSCPA